MKKARAANCEFYMENILYCMIFKAAQSEFSGSSVYKKNLACNDSIFQVKILILPRQWVAKLGDTSLTTIILGNFTNKSKPLFDNRKL